MDHKLVKTIVFVLDKLGAPFHILATVGSIGDTLEDSEVIGLLEEYLEGNDSKVIWESDDSVLKDIEQKMKRKK